MRLDPAASGFSCPLTGATEPHGNQSPLCSSASLDAYNFGYFCLFYVFRTISRSDDPQIWQDMDWTSRNTAIGRISLDDEVMHVHVLVVCCFFLFVFCFFLKCSRTVFAHLISWGLKIHYKPSTLKFTVNPSSALLYKVSPCKYH